MGIDRWAEEGVLVSVKDYLATIDDIKAPLIVAAIREFLASYPDEERPELFAALELGANSTHYELVEKVYAMAKGCIRGEVEKYGKCYLANYEEVTAALNVIHKANAGFTVPKIADIVVFGSRRLTGFWGELGEPYICFSSDDVFERVLTENGKNLQKLLGTELFVTNWTDESY